MKAFFWIGCIAILALIAIGAFLLLRADRDAPDAPAAGNYFPSLGGGTVTEGTRMIVSKDGQTLAVRDFHNNGITFEDPANPGSYFLAGETGYCLEDGTCPKAGTDEFSILFTEADQSFIIALAAEPLGEVRVRAEHYLMNALGATREELCSLNYAVGTTVSVNATYSEFENLGFSFCPGAIRLP